MNPTPVQTRIHTTLTRALEIGILRLMQSGIHSWGSQTEKYQASKDWKVLREAAQEMGAIGYAIRASDGRYILVYELYDDVDYFALCGDGAADLAAVVHENIRQYYPF